MLGRQTELILGSLFLAVGLITVFIWAPLDSETALIETHRRQTTMGDAFLPVVAGGLIAICAAAHLAMTWRRLDAADTETRAMDGSTLAFLVQLTGITAVSLAIMYWAGPLAVQLFGEDSATYRQMRGTYPFKLLGFALGGFAMVFFTTALIEGGSKRARLLSSLLAVAALIAVFDLPFDTVQLPPNGDW